MPDPLVLNIPQDISERAQQMFEHFTDTSEK